ncbi:hypothetical protein MASR2M41_00350 [Flammeovirgaceae bacterium]
MDVLEFLLLAVAIVFVSHFGLFIRTNQVRIGRLVSFVIDFRDRQVLTESEFSDLHGRYSSFLSYMEWFPDKGDYAKLYADIEFDSFVRNTRIKLRYFGIVALLAFTIFSLMAL